ASLPRPFVAPTQRSFRVSARPPFVARFCSPARPPFVTSPLPRFDVAAIVDSLLRRCAAAAKRLCVDRQSVSQLGGIEARQLGCIEAFHRRGVSSSQRNRFEARRRGSGEAAGTPRRGSGDSPHIKEKQKEVKG